MREVSCPEEENDLEDDGENHALTFGSASQAQFGFSPNRISVSKNSFAM